VERRLVSEDVPAGALFRDARDLAKAVLDLYRGGAPLWHLAFLNAAMARARDIEDAHVLFGAYPEERASSVEPALKTASQSHRGRLLTREEAGHIWEARFFPATPLGPTPRPGRAFVQGARLVEALVEFERRLKHPPRQGGHEGRLAKADAPTRLQGVNPQMGGKDLLLSGSEDPAARRR
jgi:hypothetical protein